MHTPDRHTFRETHLFLLSLRLTAVLLLFCVSVLMQTVLAFEVGIMRQPPSSLIQQNLDPDTPDSTADKFASLIFQHSMAFYSNVLRPVISSGCPCYPSCSEYMTQALLEYGFPAGLILGLERLLHEYGEFHYGTMIQTSRGLRLYDPIENNTFWWKSKRVN
jgi:putative component of membrane protein insertase Oxa1/YidC/SpoIIIJ protein YidD